MAKPLSFGLAKVILSFSWICFSGILQKMTLGFPYPLVMTNSLRT